MSTLSLALFRRACVVCSSDKFFGGLGEATFDVYLTESLVGYRFRLETLAVPNDENRLLGMMVSDPAALELPPVRLVMVPVESTLHSSSTGAERSEVTGEEWNLVPPPLRLPLVSLPYRETLRLEDSEAGLSVDLE